LEFRIQYFGEYDRLLYAEEVDAELLDIPLERARAIVKKRTCLSVIRQSPDSSSSMQEGALLLGAISGRAH
jgi:hypothetical protein